MPGAALGAPCGRRRVTSPFTAARKPLLTGSCRLVARSGLAALVATEDGNRTKDVFTRQGTNTAAPCRSGACTQAFGYDARGRVRRADDGHGGITDYKTDAPGNVTEESFTKGGVTSKESASYVGNQLRTRTTGVGTAAQKTTNSFYDAEGNLDCETAQAGTKADCSPRRGLPRAPT